MKQKAEEKGFPFGFPGSVREYKQGTKTFRGSKNEALGLLKENPDIKPGVSSLYKMTTGIIEKEKAGVDSLMDLHRASSVDSPNRRRSPNRRKYAEPDPTQVTPPRLTANVLQGTGPFSSPVAGNSRTNIMERAGLGANNTTNQPGALSPVETQQGSPTIQYQNM